MHRLLSRRGAVGVATSLVGAAGASFAFRESTLSEPQQQRKDSSLAEFRRQPPIRRASMKDALSMKADAPPVTEADPVFVGIAGGTGSGKTTVAESISKRLKVHGDRVTHICHDSYYKPLGGLPFEERAKTNFDHPDSLDTDLMVEHLKELKAGRTIHVPTCMCRDAHTNPLSQARFSPYRSALSEILRVCCFAADDFATHSRSAVMEEKRPARVVVVEGILIFSYPELRDLLDIKIFVDTDADVRFIRRLKRDINDRGRQVNSVIGQYLETVRPMHNQFVEPSKRFADVIIPTGFNSVALEMVIARLEQILGSSMPPR